MKRARSKSSVEAFPEEHPDVTGVHRSVGTAWDGDRPHSGDSVKGVLPRQAKRARSAALRAAATLELPGVAIQVKRPARSDAAAGRRPALRPLGGAQLDRPKAGVPFTLMPS
jgi:hypothetical protein